MRLACSPIRFSPCQRIREQQRIVREAAGQHVTKICHHAVRQSRIVSRRQFGRPLIFPEFQQRLDVLFKRIGGRVCDSVFASVLGLPQGSPCVPARARAHCLEERFPIGGQVHIDVNVVIDAVAVIGALDLLGNEIGRRKRVEKNSQPVRRCEDVFEVKPAPIALLGVIGKGTYRSLRMHGIADEPRVAGKIAAAGSEFIVNFPSLVLSVRNCSGKAMVPRKGLGHPAGQTLILRGV